MAQEQLILQEVLIVRIVSLVSTNPHYPREADRILSELLKQAQEQGCPRVVKRINEVLDSIQTSIDEG